MYGLVPEGFGAAEHRAHVAAVVEVFEDGHDGIGALRGDFAQALPALGGHHGGEDVDDFPGGEALAGDFDGRGVGAARGHCDSVARRLWPSGSPALFGLA